MKKINVLLPIAGKAQRFLDAGYLMPKPLIMANYDHIIDWAMKSIDHSNCNLIFAVRIDHINDFAIDDILREKFGHDIKIVVVDRVTEGAVSTCLLAEEYIKGDSPLMIYTPDVYFQDTFDPSTIDNDLDGYLLTFKSNSPNHSYVKLNETGLVERTAEKEVISENAAVGVYYFKTGDMFIDYARQLINDNIRTNNEFYICPMFDLMAQDNYKIGICEVDKMHVLGTPSELEFFTKYSSKRFGQKPVALACDHSGYDLKEIAKTVLRRNGIDYVDHGSYVNKDCDYNGYVSQAIKSMEDNLCDFSIAFCRTGQGINIYANTHKSVRGALVIDEYMAEHAIRHNCANFFSVPSRYVNEDVLDRMIKVMLKSSFDGGRHMTRMSGSI